MNTIDLSDKLFEEHEQLCDSKIDWSSSDNTIADVDQNGKVTIKAPGTVTITAKKDGVVVGQYVLGASASGNNSNNQNNNSGTNVPNTGEAVMLSVNIALALAVVSFLTARAIIKRKVRNSAR